MKKNNFWNKVVECSHNFYNNYSVSINCPTPYCKGVEYHCKKCGAYISICGCGYYDGLSGWSDKKWRSFNREQKTKKKTI